MYINKDFLFMELKIIFVKGFNCITNLELFLSEKVHVIFL